MTKLAAPLGAAALLAGTAALAHHSFSMFDPSREEVVVGTVQQWAYNSPHVLLFIEDEEGNPWVFEGAAPPSILGRSPPMTGSTLQQGQPITVIHCPLRDGRNGGGVGLVITEDGTVYNPADAGCTANQRVAEWPAWVEAGFRSRSEAEAAGGAEADPAAAPAAEPAPADAATEAAAEPATGGGAGEEADLAGDAFTQDPAEDDAETDAEAGQQSN